MQERGLRMNKSNEILKIKDLTTGYGNIQVLWDINMEVQKGSLVALVGANGVGKTTLMKTLIGVLRPWSGSIVFNGEDITDFDPDKRVKMGISLVPEGRQLFYGMTVEENLKMGAYVRDPNEDVNRDLEFVYSLFERLRERRKQLAGTLSGGEQQMCAIGRALMANPKLLLIDELSLGLAPVVVDRLIEVISRIRKERDTTIFLVEQDVEVALGIADIGYVIETGRITRSGVAKELLEDSYIKTAYLGI